MLVLITGSSSPLGAVFAPGRFDTQVTGYHRVLFSSSFRGRANTLRHLRGTHCKKKGRRIPCIQNQNWWYANFRQIERSDRLDLFRFSHAMVISCWMFDCYFGLFFLRDIVNYMNHFRIGTSFFFFLKLNFTLLHIFYI